MKKAIAILLAAMIVLGLAGCGGESNSPPTGTRGSTENGFEYVTLGNGEVAVIGYTGNETEIIIPSVIEGMNVVSIGIYWGDWGNLFSRRSDITSIVIPEGVTMIRGWTFQHYTGLTSITFPDSLTFIGHGAFWECTGLTNIVIPDNNIHIQELAFADCIGLTYVVIPDSTYIDYRAFGGIEGLTVTYKGGTYEAVYHRDRQEWDLPLEFYNKSIRHADPPAEN